MKSIEQLKKKDLNCNIFSVYDYDGLTITELLCQFFTKINECIDISNETIDLAKWLVNEGLELEVAKKLVMWLEDGTLENIINVNLFNTLNEKINGLSSQLEQSMNDINEQFNAIESERFRIMFKPKSLGGNVEDSVALQNYINYKTGKDGICIIPEGTYAITNGIIVNHGCKLVGQGNVVFNVFDLNNSCITISNYSTIKNIAFNYPNQVISCTPTRYPATIKSSNEGCAYSNIEDITLKNSYVGIYLNNSVNKVNINNIIGFPLYLGLYIDNSLDVVRLSNIHFNCNINGDLYDDSLVKWVLENGKGIHLRRCDNPQLNNIHMFGYNIGLHLHHGENGGSCSMLECNNMLIDITSKPLYIQNVQDGTFFNNCYFTSFDNYLNVSGQPVVIDGYSSELTTNVYFNNCCFKNYLDNAILCNNNASFNNCHIVDYNKINQMYNAINITGDNIVVNISNTTIDGKNKGQVRGILNTHQNSKIYISNTTIKNCDTNRAIHSDYENVFISSIDTKNEMYIGGKNYTAVFPSGIATL